LLRGITVSIAIPGNAKIDGLANTRSTAVGYAVRYWNPQRQISRSHAFCDSFKIPFLGPGRESMHGSAPGRGVFFSGRVQAGKSG
jgi:hypothetical protein